MYLSVPCIFSQSEEERIIEGKLTDDELLAINASASVIKKSLIELIAEK